MARPPPWLLSSAQLRAQVKVFGCQKNYPKFLGVRKTTTQRLWQKCCWKGRVHLPPLSRVGVCWLCLFYLASLKLKKNLEKSKCLENRRKPCKIEEPSQKSKNLSKNRRSLAKSKNPYEIEREPCKVVKPFRHRKTLSKSKNPCKIEEPLQK